MYKRRQQVNTCCETQRTKPYHFKPGKMLNIPGKLYVHTYTSSYVVKIVHFRRLEREIFRSFFVYACDARQKQHLWLPFSLRPDFFLFCPDGSLRERKDKPPERPGTEGAAQERVWRRFRRRQPLVQILQAPDGFRIPGAFFRVKHSGIMCASPFCRWYHEHVGLSHTHFLLHSPEYVQIAESWHDLGTQRCGKPLRGVSNDYIPRYCKRGDNFGQLDKFLATFFVSSLRNSLSPNSKTSSKEIYELANEGLLYREEKKRW